MPDLLGLTLAAARSALSAADAGEYSWVYGCYGSPNTGLVVRQTLAGGVSVPRTETVYFYLQASNCTFTMPDLLGLTLASARSALSAADAGEYSWVYGCYGSPNTGLVVRQSAAGGASVPRTETVEFFLQASNCTFTMPDLLGLTLASARSALSAADAGEYSWVYGCYGSPNTGLVVRQTPTGGVSVPRTETVYFYLQANNC